MCVCLCACVCLCVGSTAARVDLYVYIICMYVCMYMYTYIHMTTDGLNDRTYIDMRVDNESTRVKYHSSSRIIYSEYH